MSTIYSLFLSSVNLKCVSQRKPYPNYSGKSVWPSREENLAAFYASITYKQTIHIINCMSSFCGCGICARTAKWRWPLPLCVSDVISSVIIVPSAPKSPAPDSSSHDWSLPLSEGQLCVTTSSSSIFNCVSAFIDTTMMLKNKQLIKYKAASFSQRAAWWKWWTARVVSRGRSPLALTVVRVVHSWAQAFGATLDEKLSNPSARQRFMRFAKKHC